MPSENCNTICNKCIFAEYSKGNQQKGCQAGRLEKFADQGSQLDLHTEEGGKTSYIIKDRICLMCCTQETVQKHKMTDPLRDMRKLISLRATIFIFYDDESNHENLKATIDSCLRQTHKASEINLIYDSAESTANIIRYLKEQCDKEFFNWKITRILDRGPDGEQPSISWCFDHAIHNCNNPFYSTFTSGFVLPENYLESIDKALNDNLERFCLLTPVDDWNGMLVQTFLHKMLKGNMPMTMQEEGEPEFIGLSIEQKIKYYAEKVKQPNIVKKVEDICPTIKK